MNHASKKFFAALLACAAAWMAWAPGAAFALGFEPSEPRVTVTLVNKTNAVIFYVVAERRKDDKDGSSVHCQEVPRIIKPGEKDEIGFVQDYVNNPTKNPNDYKFGIYAASPAAGRVWAGEKETVWPEVGKRAYTNNRGEFFCVMEYALSKNNWYGYGCSPTGKWLEASDRDVEEALKNSKNSKRMVFWPFTAGKNVTLTFTDKGISMGNQGNANAKQQKKPAAKPAKPTAQQQKKPAAKPANANAKPAVNANAAIRGNKVNIRSAPSSKASVLLQVNNGDLVHATGKTATDSKGGKWIQLKALSGKIGWVFSDYINIW